MPKKIVTPEEKLQRAQRRHEKLKRKLELLESSPDDKCVDIDVLCELKGRSLASIWRDVKAGRLPQPIKTGPRSSRWRLGDVRTLKSEEV